MTTAFKRSFSDPRQAEAAIQNAKELGFEVRDIALRGSWEAEGESFYGDGAEELVKTGTKYFHLRLDVTNFDREVWRCEPVNPSSDALDEGEMIIEFSDA